MVPEARFGIARNKAELPLRVIVGRSKAGQVRPFSACFRTLRLEVLILDYYG
jgi:hypothetical protein